MTITCVAAWIAALLTIPFLLIYLATESQEQRIRRWHRGGESQRQIAVRLLVSHYRVRFALA